MSLKYRGALVEEDPDLAYRAYVESLKGADLAEAQIDALIASGLSSYTLKSYVDSQDGLLATQAYIDAADALRVPLSAKDQASGVAALLSGGRIDPNRINGTYTQNYFRGPWAPTAYPSVAATLTTEATVFTCPVADPGYPYKLMVYGEVDARIDSNTEYPSFLVRVGNATTGQIIARGRGASDDPSTVLPTLGDDFNAASTGLNPNNWDITQLLGGSGQYSTANGEAFWEKNGTEQCTMAYRKINNYAKAQTDYQRVRTYVTTAGQSPSFGGGQFLTLRGRLSDDSTQWVGAKIEDDLVRLQYSVAGSAIDIVNGSTFAVSPSNTVSAGTGTNTAWDLVCGTVNSVRQILLLRQNVVVLGAVESTDTPVTALGASNRGWGFIGHAGDRPLTQTAPPSLDYIAMDDCPPVYAPAVITPVGLDAMTPLTGPTTLYVRGLRSGASATVTASPFQPRLHVMAFAA